MKKIGIIFAMEEEINAFKEHIHIDKEESIFDLHLYEGTFNNNQCIFTVSGVGKVNSARTCQILIDHYNTDIVINVGVAGGINSTLKVGDIIIGEKLVQHDFDIAAFNHKLGYIPNVGIYINSDPYLVNLSKKILKNSNYIFYTGTIASGDIFCTDKEQSIKLVLDTIKAAKRKEKITAEVQLHSDQGFQYTSQAYFNLTQSYGITPSMSRRGNPYDNALAENFFSILKTECIHRVKLSGYDEARLIISEYINFYNNYRIQTKTKLTPLEKRNQFVA